MSFLCPLCKERGPCFLLAHCRMPERCVRGPAGLSILCESRALLLNLGNPGDHRSGRMNTWPLIYPTHTWYCVSCMVSTAVCPLTYCAVTASNGCCPHHSREAAAPGGAEPPSSHQHRAPGQFLGRGYRRGLGFSLTPLACGQFAQMAPLRAPGSFREVLPSWTLQTPWLFPWLPPYLFLLEKERKKSTFRLPPSSTKPHVGSKQPGGRGGS